MNQQQNAISLARVSAASLVRKSQAWDLVKHRHCLRIVKMLKLWLIILIGILIPSSTPCDSSLANNARIDSLIRYQKKHCRESASSDTICSMKLVKLSTKQKVAEYFAGGLIIALMTIVVVKSISYNLSKIN